MRSLIACSSIALVLLGNGLAASQQEQSLSIKTTAIVLRLLEATGYRYAKAGDGSWRFNFKGDSRDDIPVWVVASDSELAIIAVIASSDEPIGEEGLRALLRANRSIDIGTISIDSDGDYVIQVSYDLERLEKDTFKLAVETAANSADDVYKALKAAAGPRSSSTEPRRRFSAPREATKAIELLNGRATLALDPKAWTETKSNEPGRRTFSHESGDLYGLVITERIAVPTALLRDIVLQNLREAAPDARIVEEQRREVNGTEVLMMRTEATVNGVAVTYVGNYFGREGFGTVQVIAYTGQSLLGEHRAAMDAFANGLRIVK